MLTRRAALALGVTFSATALSGCLSRTYAVESSVPGRWPMARRDPGNRAKAPRATPPTSEPEIDWQRSFHASDHPAQLVVTPETVFAARALGVSALDRETGDTRWRTDGRGQTPAEGTARLACLKDRTFYTADGTALRAYDFAGELQWEEPFPASDSRTRGYGLVAGADTLFWGTHGRLTAFGTDGTHRYTFELQGSGDVFPGVGTGRLYVAGPGRLIGGKPPGILELVLGDGPSVTWRSGPAGRPTWPVVVGERVLVGDRSFAGASPGPHTVRAFRPNGSPDWSAEVDGPTSNLAISRASNLVYVVETGADAGGRVTALDVERGDRVWTRDQFPLDDAGGSIAVAGDTLMVGGFSRESEDSIRALDAADGETRWETRVQGMVTHLVAVGEEVFVATSLGHVYALA